MYTYILPGLNTKKLQIGRLLLIFRRGGGALHIWARAPWAHDQRTNAEPRLWAPKRAVCVQAPWQLAALTLVVGRMRIRATFCTRHSAGLH